VRVAGQAVAALNSAQRDRFRARNVGFVLQTLHLIGILSARDNLRLAQRLAGRGVDEARIDEVLEALAIAHVGARKARDLSAGEAQRVAIARALVNRPTLVLADEPTSALDDASCEKAITLLIDRAAQCGATLVVATHDQRVRSRFARSLAL